ncbi:Ff.00g029100.m01.CDS01 [Fusarium sp. VM40]|nr:Ff.00g029100.m01.CDS01 [Fusarium sp. VM40]
MASNDPSASCVQPPPDLLVEKVYQPMALLKRNGRQMDSCPFSSSPSPSNVKSFTPRTRKALEEYLCSSHSGPASSVDKHTPPPKPKDQKPKKSQKPQKPKKDPELEQEQKKRWKIRPKKLAADEPDQILRGQFVGPPAGIPPFDREKKWDNSYPYPANEDWPEEDEFNFTPKVFAKPIDPEPALFNLELESEVHFLEPLHIQGAIRQEYAAHTAEGQQSHDKILRQMNEARRMGAEKTAIKEFDFNETTAPVEHRIPRPEMQQGIYDHRVKISGLTRKIAVCDGTLAGMIAGEFTYRPDYAHLPPTEKQMAILRDAESLRGLYPQEKSTNSNEFAPGKESLASERSLSPKKCRTSHDSTPEPSLYDQWLKKQSANVCTASKWIDEEEKSAKRQAFKEALSKQLEARFPAPMTAPIDDTVEDEERKWAAQHFPYLPPKTETDLQRQNMWDTPLKVDVPRWFPTFAKSGVIRLDKRNSKEKQYQEFLTTVWRLESQMLNNKNKPDIWDKKWHEPSARWTQPFQQTGGG